VIEVTQGRKLSVDGVLVEGLILGVCVIGYCWFGMLYLLWRGSLLYVVLENALHHTKGAELARCTLVKSVETENYDTSTASTVNGC
jgi:hypothetical protein